jgi:hypothetical protein
VEESGAARAEWAELAVFGGAGQAAVAAVDEALAALGAQPPPRVDAWTVFDVVEQQVDSVETIEAGKREWWWWWWWWG